MTTQAYQHDNASHVSTSAWQHLSPSERHSISGWFQHQGALRNRKCKVLRQLHQNLLRKLRNVLCNLLRNLIPNLLQSLL